MWLQKLLLLSYEYIIHHSYFIDAGEFQTQAPKRSISPRLVVRVRILVGDVRQKAPANKRRVESRLLWLLNIVPPDRSIVRLLP